LDGISSRITYEASTSAATAAVDWNACARFRRISEYFGGPQIATKGMALASRVESPDPTTKDAPQKPPKDLNLADGQNSRVPMPNIQRPVMKLQR